MKPAAKLAPPQPQQPRSARAFKVHEDKENAAVVAKAGKAETAETSKGLSSRAQDAVLSSFQPSARANIPRVFQLTEEATLQVDKVGGLGCGAVG